MKEIKTPDLIKIKITKDSHSSLKKINDTSYIENSKINQNGRMTTTANQRAASVRFNEDLKSNYGYNLKVNNKNAMLPPKGHKIKRQRSHKKLDDVDISYLTNYEGFRPAVFPLSKFSGRDKDEERFGSNRKSSLTEPKLHQMAEACDYSKEIKTFKDLLISYESQTLLGKVIPSISSQAMPSIHQSNSSSFCQLMNSNKYGVLNKRNSINRSANRQCRPVQKESFKAENKYLNIPKSVDKSEILKCNKLNPITSQYKVMYDKYEIINRSAKNASFVNDINMAKNKIRKNVIN